MKTGYAYVAICNYVGSCVGVGIRSTVAGQCAFCVGGSMMTKQWRHVRLIKAIGRQSTFTSLNLDRAIWFNLTRDVLLEHQGQPDIRGRLHETSQGFASAWDERSHVISSVARFFLLDNWPPVVIESVFFSFTWFWNWFCYLDIVEIGHLIFSSI